MRGGGCGWVRAGPVCEDEARKVEVESARPLRRAQRERGKTRRETLSTSLSLSNPLTKLGQEGDGSLEQADLMSAHQSGAEDAALVSGH